MKKNRQEAIIELIQKYPIETQEELDKIITERLEPLIQRKILLENQHLLNLDKTAVWNVIEQDMKKNK